ncbi:MAG: hypothetical protein HUU35_13745, partial [Armatimonadetes bacterium]|nr:hypothetical protein [Armatimonadota bacterium]
MEAERLHGMGPAWELGGLTAGPAELQPGTAQLRAEVLRRQTPFLARRVLLAESLRASEGTPWWILRRARATAHLLNRCPIAIRKGERLVGAHPATPAVDSQAVAQAEAYLARQSFHVRAASGQVALDLVTILHHGLDGLLAQLRRLRAELRLLDPHRAERRTFYEAAEIALEGFQRFVLRYALLARQQAAAEAARRDELLAT